MPLLYHSCCGCYYYYYCSFVWSVLASSKKWVQQRVVLSLWSFVQLVDSRSDSSSFSITLSFRGSWSSRIVVLVCCGDDARMGRFLELEVGSMDHHVVSNCWNTTLDSWSLEYVQYCM